jgi:hypothetical protein
VLTTIAARHEDDVRRALHLPSTHALAALVALGHPRHAVTRLRRRTVEEFTTVDTFDGPRVQL